MRKHQVSEAIKDLCQEFEIEIIDPSRYPVVRQTRATATLERLLEQQGDGHLRLVLSTLVEAGPNGALLDSRTLMATSELVLIYSDWIEADPSSWFEAWDTLPVGEISWLLRGLRGVKPAHRVLLGALYVVLQNMRDGNGMDKMIRDSVDRKLFDIMKRPATQHDRNRDTAATLGRTILAAQRLMQPQAFGTWLESECGISTQHAKRLVKLAQEADQEQKAAA
jgi:hypothetical protein